LLSCDRGEVMSLTTIIKLTHHLEQANKVKDKLAEFNRDAHDDKHFRELVLEYFKPEIRY